MNPLVHPVISCGYTVCSPFLQPTMDTIAGQLIQDCLTRPETLAFQVNLREAGCWERIGIVAVRALAYVVITIAAVADILYWLARTISVVPMLKRGCKEHFKDFVPVVALPILLLGAPAGYLPRVKPTTLEDAAELLKRALGKRDANEIEKIVNEFGKEVLQAREHGYPIFMGYIFERYLPTLEKMIQLGLNIHERDSMGYTPLDYASHHSEDGIKCMEFLLKHGADIRQTRFANEDLTDKLTTATVCKSYVTGGGYGVSHDDKQAAHYVELMKMCASLDISFEGNKGSLIALRQWVEDLTAALIPQDNTPPQPATLNRLFNTIVPGANLIQEKIVNKCKDSFGLRGDNFTQRDEPFRLPLDKPVSLNRAKAVHWMLTNNMPSLCKLHDELVSMRSQMIAWRELQKIKNPEAPLPFVPLSEVPSKCAEIKAWHKQHLKQVTPLQPELVNIVTEYLY